MKAFPIPEHTKRDFEYPNQYEGMDLRDYFAAKAIQSIIYEVLSRDLAVTSDHCKQAYQLADGMMEARSK